MKNDAIEKKKDLCKDIKYKIGCLLERQPTMWLWSETKGRLVFFKSHTLFHFLNLNHVNILPIKISIDL